MPDNFHFDMSCAPLDKSLEIAFQGSPNRKATHWRVDDTGRLILAWHDLPEFIPLPAPLDAAAAEVFVEAWLNDGAKYGTKPDHDGDNEKSWRIYNESWGHVDGNHYAFVAIEPIWAMYGK